MKKKFVSSSLEQAMSKVREGMTVQQQAHVFHKEGKLFFERGDVQGALECINEAIALNPSPSYYVSRAGCHKQLQKFTDAYFDYSFAIRLEPESGSLYCQRGLCLARLERLTLAIEDLDEACRVNIIHLIISFSAIILSLHQLEPIPLNFYSRACVHADAKNNEAAIAGNVLLSFMSANLTVVSNRPN